MNVTAEVRCTVLKLFNVSEAARQIGVPVSEMFRWIYSGFLPSPGFRLGRRYYFTQADIDVLTRRCSEIRNHP
jgi:DNA-binding transcriptional MerR regulator